MIFEMLKAFAMIFMAEMGDKTQIIAMGLALKYPMRKILIGIALGVFVNHGLAIMLGSMLSRVMPIEWLQVAAGALFIFFAFGSLKIEDEEVEEEKTQYGVVFAVALSFFLGEMGDKTQLTALGLGSTSSYPFFVLIGTTLGMIFTSLIGILIGIKLGKNIDQGKLKIGAFLVFSIFGVEKLYSYLFSPYGLQLYFWGFLGLYLLMSYLMNRRFIKGYKELKETQFQRQSQELYDLKHKIENTVERICRGCEVCDGKECLIGYLKELLKRDQSMSSGDLEIIKPLLNKSFDIKEAMGLLESIMSYYERFEEEYKQNELLIEVRSVLELIAFEHLIEADSFDDYKGKIENQ
jgi:putative Ca2+/H+ antiporter (TMEM165/GDT1 family)